MEGIKFRLPFDGQWLVSWGGNSKKLNLHYDIAAQKYAQDFVMADAAGKTYRTDGLTNKDYFCYGQDVLATAGGEVVEVVDGVRDNRPGDTNPYMKTGNYVLIKHAYDKFSFFAHLKRSSVSVKLGDVVKTAQKLGECGNSGNSSEPHLHYHLQNSFIFNRFGKDWKLEDVAKGVKVRFSDVLVEKDGKKTAKKYYSPIKGDLVEPA